MAEVGRDCDGSSHEICNSMGAIIDEQNDIRKLVQDLAQQINAIRSGVRPGDTPAESSVVSEQVAPEGSAPALLEIEDLKRKAH